jgi:hypothetical protein
VTLGEALTQLGLDKVSLALSLFVLLLQLSDQTGVDPHTRSQPPFGLSGEDFTLLLDSLLFDYHSPSFIVSPAPLQLYELQRMMSSADNFLYCVVV